MYRNNRQMYYNFSTIEDVDICMEEQDTEDKYKPTTPCNQAARNGSVLVLMYLQLMGCPSGVRACNNAAKYGHLSILQ
jgi:hypothetical protein